MNKNQRLEAAADFYFAERGRIEPEDLAEMFSVRTFELRILIAQIRLLNSIHN